MKLGFFKRRFLLFIPTYFGITIIVFLLIHLTPGDPIVTMLGEEYDPHVAAKLRHDLGLDRPIIVQYFVWLGKVFQGDLGESIYSEDPVLTLLVEKAKTTVPLAVGSMMIGLLIAVPVGVLSAIYRNAFFDNISRILSMIGACMPIFWLGLILIILFAVKIQIFPPGGTIAEYGLRAIVLPCFAIGFFNAAFITRMTRASMLEVLSEDYIRTARAKGVNMPGVYLKHALRNAILPIVTLIGLQLGQTLGGAVLTETVFNLPGIGRLLILSVGRRDYPVIQGCILVVASAFVFSNLVVDFLYSRLDPRVKL
jgi:peptide/nickel transport system permease protein